MLQLTNLKCFVHGKSKLQLDTQLYYHGAQKCYQIVIVLVSYMYLITTYIIHLVLSLSLTASLDVR